MSKEAVWRALHEKKCFGLFHSFFANTAGNIFGLYERYKLVRYTILFLPALFGFTIIVIFGVNVLFWDEWEIPVFVDQILSKGFSFELFFAQHNEHRIFFPSILFFILSLITRMNSKAFMLASWLLCLIIYVMIIKYIKRVLPACSMREKKEKALLYLAIGFCCFNLAQLENFFWGFQLGFYMVAFSVVGSFYFLAKAHRENRGVYIIPACVFGIIASFSSIHGLLTWLVIFGVYLLLIISRSKIKMSGLLTLVIFTSLSFMIYFLDYHDPNNHPDYFGTPLLGIIEYFFAAIGSSLVVSLLPAILAFCLPALGIYLPATLVIYSAVFVGSILFFSGIIITIYVVVKKKSDSHIFPLCLLYYGYAFCGSITMGRSGFGVLQALSSRYITFSIFIVIGLTLIIYPEFIFRKAPTGFRRSCSLFICLLLSLATLQNINFSGCFIWYRSRKEQMAIIKNYENQPLDKLSKSYPWNTLEAAYKNIELVKKHHWSVFSGEAEL